MSVNRIPRPLLWMGGLIALLLLLVLILSLLNWNALRAPLTRMMSRKIERPVAIDGNLRVHLWSWTPSAEIEGLTIGNPDWVGKDNMIELPRLKVAVVLKDLFAGHLVLANLELDHPKVQLLRDERGRANWDFGTSKPRSSKPEKPTRLPPLRHFALNGGSLDLDDAIRKLTFKGKVCAQESGSGHGSEPFSLQGVGTLNQEPFKLTFTGGALLDIQLDHPYVFQTAVDAGSSGVRVRGTIAKPFDFGVLDADIDLQGHLLTRKDQTVPIRCGVIEFKLKNGDAQAEHIVFDTENVIVTGDGHIALGDEALDLNIKGEPKKPRFDRVRARR